MAANLLRSDFAHRLCICLLLLGLGTSVASGERRTENSLLTAALDSITTPELKVHVETLADDSFEGREAGSRGGRAAGIYLIKEFERHGLKPMGDSNTYFQSFEGSSRNILGLLPGSDPALKNEVIVIGAHYDHVGYGSPRNSYGPFGKIHNGADDNASGVSGLLETLDALRKMPSAPRRSILFAFWDGEEKGLNGSKHWLANPTTAIKNIVFCINVDMIGRLRDQGLEIIGSRTLPKMRQRISEINRSHRVPLDFTWTIKEDSDHYPFYARNIPIVMFHTGLHADYHTPRDDAHLVNYEGVTKVSQLMCEFLWSIASDDDLPKFREQARRESIGNLSMLLRGPPTTQPRFGLSWMRDAESNKILVTAVTPQSPAERSGVRKGDEIVDFNGWTVDDERRLRLEILYAPKNVPFTVRRTGSDEPIVLTAEPHGSPIRVGLVWQEDDAEPGVLVLTHVVPHSAAAMAGLKIGDRIDRLNGERFENAENFMLRTSTAGDEPVLRVERKGILQDVQLQLLPLRVAKQE